MIDFNRIPNPSFGIMRIAAENLLCHPFLVLRRQCQVKKLNIYDITPVSTILLG